MIDLVQAMADLKSGATTSQKLVEACLDEIASRNDDLNALLQVYDTEAIAAAEASDKRRHKGEAKSDFDGVPVILKANISHQGHVTSAGSRMLEHYVAPYDATIVTKLKEAGAIIIGSSNMDEFAMGSSGENSAFGPTKNPLDTSRVPGGSSSGSAASVAAGFAPLALGSDTGGSIRLPAAFCGVVGLKPTYGAVSRYGLLAMSSSLDQIGPLTTTVASSEAAFNLLQGFDNRDSTSEDPTYLKTKTTYTIGVPKQFGGPELVTQACNKLKALNFEIKEIDVPSLANAAALYYIICPAEVSANMARYDGIRFGLKGDTVTDSRTKGFGDEVKRRIMLGTYVLSAGYSDKFYNRALSGRQLLIHELDRTFTDVDIILGLVSPTLPFKLGEKKQDPLAMYMTDLYTIPANLAGLPALSMPYQKSPENLPIGLQLMGPKWSEPWLFDIGTKMESL